jgi:glycosyltransferase involved in cell wall biosynthesis
MGMIWLAFPAMVILAVRLWIVIYNQLSFLYLPAGASEESGLVSVLIPARNEEENLPSLLDGLINQHYSHLEIIVYDDQSTDRTGEILEKYSREHERITVLNGEPLPDGWTGKNHACHQLAWKARGAYLLFLDADVKVSPGLVGRAVGYARQKDLSLLSVFPRQIMKSMGERLTVPVMNWILLSLLPMRLIRTSHYSSLSAANGQMMLFRAREYHQHSFHRMVKEINVEDIHIIRRMKKMGYLAQTLLSRGEVSCRMYRNYREAVFGFTRSMFAFFGGSGLTMILFTLFSSLGVVFVWLGMSAGYAALYLAIAALMRMLIHAMSHQPVIRLMLLSPLIQLTFIWMVIGAFRMKFKGTHTWKDRSIQFKGI